MSCESPIQRSLKGSDDAMRTPVERIKRSRIGPFKLGPRYLAREAKLKMDRNARESSGVTLVAVKGEIYAPLNESVIAQEAVRGWPGCLIGAYTRGVKISDIAEDIESMMDDCQTVDTGDSEEPPGKDCGCCPSASPIPPLSSPRD